MQFPITIGLHRSFWVWLLPVVGASLVLLLAAFLAVPDWVRGAMLVSCLSGLALVLGRQPLAHRIAALRLSADGSISLAFDEAPDYFLPAALLPGATVHPRLTVLRLSCRGRTYPVVLTPGASFTREFRQLRVFVRWLGKFNAPDADV